MSSKQQRTLNQSTQKMKERKTRKLVHRKRSGMKSGFLRSTNLIQTYHYNIRTIEQLTLP
ncbi:hypothetical protein NECAME_08810 [Necator americanus]|uniref:Uncharacterized protein n=1 Tax=Necator americanus TaxID=51031 RepID=W2TGP5_NECAM|nr:hypothetical protein NECAME_08810 [Necator americanus]ETN81008.1 hypothetical protein NECAME_08810 [Necator americanus]